MINRRHFFLGIGACVCDLSAEAKSQEFACAVLDDPPMAPSLSLDPVTELSGLDLSSLASKHSRLTPYGTARVQDAWLPSLGLTPNTDRITLGIAFCDGVQSQQAAVQAAASQWLTNGLEKKVAFAFGVSLDAAQIRISFASDKNWSAIGRHALEIEATPTLYLETVSSNVILHEFGHALGLQHEHLFPKSSIRWNEELVIQEMKKIAGWSASTTRREILNALSADAICVGDPSFNPSSIMMYPISSGWAEIQDETGAWVPFVPEQENTISDRDFSCLKSIYKV